MEQNLIVDFITEIADKNVEMVGGVLLVVVIRLVRPVNANFLIVQSSAKPGVIIQHIGCLQIGGRVVR